MQKHTRKIGTNRGKRRIWLEGKELTDHGIYYGARFDVYPGNNRLVIKISPEGKRKIAGTPARPIIDMTGGTVTAAFDDSVTHFEITRSGLAERGIALVAIKP